MSAHVFIDNSNVFGGAQRAAATIEPDALWIAIRVYYRNLFRLIEHSHQATTRVLAGSVPPGNDALWQHAREAGYDTDLLRRVNRDDGRLSEQGVDEVLHLKIANALLDFSPPQTLILASGDGNESEFGTSFIKQIERALKHGWKVIVWSWKDQLSGKFRQLAKTNGGNLSVNHFDDHYWSITFIQQGQFEVNGSLVTLTGRVVHKQSFQ